MVDIICRYCGEPWSYHAAKHDLEKGDKILHGEGCPSCEWGSTIDKPEYTDDWRRSLFDIDEDPIKYL